MTFQPQYSQWAMDHFTNSSDAVYINPDELEINNGVIGLIPDLFSGQFSPFDSPWDPVSSWTFQNSLDSYFLVTSKFSIVSATGLNSPYSGNWGNSGDVAQTAFFTQTVTPVVDSNGIYTGGAASCFVYNGNADSLAAFGNTTVEVSVRSLKDNVTHDLYTEPSTGVSCHGIYWSNGINYAFVEIHPDGLKIHGVTGAILPGDFSSSMRRIRFAKRTALTIMLDDGSSMHIPSALKTLPTTGNVYVAFGAPPLYTGTATFSGVQFNETPLYDKYGLTGIGGFEGTVLWDDLKVKFGEATYKDYRGYQISWPTGVKTLYTAPWYPDRIVNSYAGAVIDSIPAVGGCLTVTAQYLIPSGLSGNSNWTDSNNNINLYDKSQSQNFLDMSNIPLYHGIQNGIRFKVQADSSGLGPGHSIDAITVIGNTTNPIVDIVPNWKMSALPKDIFFKINSDNYNAMIPEPHYEDEIYLHNEAGTTGIHVSEYVPAPEAYLGSGQVLTSSTATNLIKVDDSFYGSAWRNFQFYTGLSGHLFGSSYYNATTGIFVGDLLDSFNIYPSLGSVPSSMTGVASVIYSVNSYNNTDGNIINAQKCTVQGYTLANNNSTFGFRTAGISGTPNTNTVGIYEGIIQIERGPGVTVSMYDGNKLHTYLLDGELYRTPRWFGLAVPYTGSSTNTYVVFGVKPRPYPVTGLIADQYGTWTDELNYHNYDEFTLYDFTGYVAKNTYLQYSIDSDPSRTIPLNDTDIYNTVPFKPVRRDSVIFEGYFRPYGILNGGDDAELFRSVSSDNRGISVSINRTGEVKASVHLNIHAASLGYTGDTIWAIGPRGNGTMVTGQTGAVTITSDGNTIAWGELNHIGVYQDVRALGDTYTATNQPQIGTTGLVHGARSAKIYLELNGRIVNSYDIGVDPWINYIESTNSITPSYPTSTTYTESFPRIPIYATTGTVRTTTIGSGMVSDFDHVRFGIRTYVDAKTASNVYGAKSGPPTFTPYDAIKIPDPISGSLEHIQYAHIYRFDHPDSYAGWDDGFSIDHALYPNYTSYTPFLSRGIRTSKQLLKKTDGINDRNGIKIGPGMNIIVPASTYDGRLFNGTGSCSLALATIGGSNGMYMVNNASYTGPQNMGTWSSNIPINLTSSNSRFVAGGHFRISSYPLSGFAELFSYQEANGASSFGNGSVYVGLNTGGNIVYGTRRGSSVPYDGNGNGYIVGPFTGSQMPINEYFHIGIDAALHSGNGSLTLYTGGQIDSIRSVVLTEVGALSTGTGRPVGYQGFLSSPLQLATQRPQFVIGGEPLRDGYLSYPFLERDVASFFIGFPLSGYTWPWARFAQTGVAISGHNDIAIKNSSTVIGDVIGTGVGIQAFTLGMVNYPATNYSGAGEHAFWATANNGNDFENRQDFGVHLYDDALFNNAYSYYATYQNDSIRATLGSTDSPIQLGTRVPPEGINLALVSNKEWNSDSSSTTFDMSDQNYANITNKLNGDITISTFNGSYTGGYVSQSAVTSNDIRLSSYPIWDYDTSNAYIGYFAHLIGGEGKAIYIQSSTDHLDVTGNYNEYYHNLDKIAKAISVKDADGNILSFDEFPYNIIVTPFKYVAPLNSFSGDVWGWTGAVNQSYINNNQSFTVIMIAAYQTIGKTVFIHYPSKEFHSENINLQDSEIYNPVPLMKRVPQEQVYDSNGNVDIQSGTFSVELSSQLKRYNVTVWNANFSGWI